MTIPQTYSQPLEGHRRAPFMTCVTATCFGPIEQFLTWSHRKRIYLPLNKLKAPTWKDGRAVIKPSRFTDLLVEDIGGHARAMDLMADLLIKYENGPHPKWSEFADELRTPCGRHDSTSLSSFPANLCYRAQQNTVLTRRWTRASETVRHFRLKVPISPRNR